MSEQTILQHKMETDDWHDALTGEHVPVSEGQQNWELEPFGYRILWRTL